MMSVQRAIAISLLMRTTHDCRYWQDHHLVQQVSFGSARAVRDRVLLNWLLCSALSEAPTAEVVAVP